MTISRSAIVAEARAWVGTPYRHQGSLRGIGCDCLGLLRGLWRAVIGPEPERPDAYSPDWAEAGGNEALLEAAQRHLMPLADCAFADGDVLLFRFRMNVPAKHIGIATSATHMIHAHEGACVAEVPIVPFWRRRIAASFSFPGVESAHS
ncbi:MAG: C40 family peptidase [Methylobacteriaceae bacterium]|nr:C40 family peptidase [Methylobacteriaceae bacterium]